MCKLQEIFTVFGAGRNLTGASPGKQPGRPLRRYLLRRYDSTQRRIATFATIHSVGAFPLMPCILLLVVLAFPRVVLVLMFLLSDYLTRAYHGLLLPLLGFIFLPLTTLTYAWEVNSHMAIQGVNLLLLIIAVVVDLGGLSGGEWHRRSRW